MSHEPAANPARNRVKARGPAPVLWDSPRHQNARQDLTTCGFGRCERVPECTNRCAWRIAHINASAPASASTSGPKRPQKTAHQEDHGAIVDLVVAIVIVMLCGAVALILAHQI
jgi:hypothetical protein